MAKPVTSSRKTELSLSVFLAVSLLVFWGSSSEGQASLFDSVVRRYVVETATAVGTSRRSTNSQIAEINSYFATSGAGGAVASPASSDVPAVQQSAFLAVSAPDSGYIDAISNRRSQVIEYVIQEGDLISFIASDYGVSVESILWANGLTDPDTVAIGQTIRIPPVTGVLHKAQKGDTAESIAKKYGADAERIIAYNRLPKDGSLDIGDEIVVPDGRIKGVPAVKSGSVAVASGASKSQFGHLPDLKGYFMLPLTGYNWGRIHGRNGVDTANSCGTPFYAAADGTVTVVDVAGWNGGYGQYLKIAHPNGTETLYAHASKIFVSAGQAVSKGQKIALVGTTGRSTGCHLHFEVHGARNPMVKY